MAALKPCPFCGGTAELIHPASGAVPYVMCTENYCTQPSADCVAKWNTRVNAEGDGEFEDEVAA